MKELRTYYQNDEERSCICNYSHESLIFDCDHGLIYCPICATMRLMPDYWEFLTRVELLEYYFNPDKKVYDFGEKGFSVPANESVINYVRHAIGY